MKNTHSPVLLVAAVLCTILTVCTSDVCIPEQTSSVHVDIIENVGTSNDDSIRELVVDFNEEYNGGVTTPLIVHVYRENRLVFQQFFEWGADERGKLYKGWIDREEIAMQLFDTFSPVQFEFDILFHNINTLALTRCLNVTLRVVDLDDNTPLFSDSFVHITFEDDNVETGKERPLPHPGDHDEGNNGTTIYELVDTSGKFGLEFRNYTGTERAISLTLRNNLPLDYEERASYQLELHAREDNGDPDGAVLMINVSVVDVCDEPSSFSTSRYTPSISENATRNTVVVTVEATDDDDQEVCPLRYAVTRACGRETTTDHCIYISTTSQFALDSETGILTLTDELDRERISEYEVTVQAADSQQSSATAVVVITIDDVNDNYPEVISNILDQVPEHQMIDHTRAIGHFTALDADAGPNGQVSVSLLDNSTGLPLASETFTIVTENYIDYRIILNRTLDYETQREFHLIIQVHDSGTPPLYRNVAVTIRIEDHNDHPPVFGSVPNNTIAENSVENTFVVAVTATDADSGSNAVVTFELPESSDEYPHQHLFTINSGNIQVGRDSVLDYETHTRYTLLVLALNSESSDYQEARKEVTVFLSNENDNRPLIAIPLVEVRETLAVHEMVGQIFATDADNLEPLAYSLAPGSSSLFSIGPSDGVLYLEEPLDYELSTNHMVTVNVSDGHFTRLADVSINVLPVNDEPPVFSPEPITANVLEEEVDELVTTVTATDRDNPPQSLDYMIRQGAHMERFRITSEGKIYTTQRLDREETANYTLWVQATDGELNSTLKEVFVQVIDINDHVPEFTNVPYNFPLLENNSQNPTVGTVTVISLDEGPNRVVRFDITAGNPDRWFSIDEQSGEITANRAFDHETDVSPIVLTVRAMDMGQPNSLSDSTIVTITITDVNDNEPVFPDSIYYFVVQEDYPIGQVFGEVVARDPDGIGNNDTLYSFSAETDASAFHIEELTGELSLVSSLDYETTNFTTFDVIATDDTRRDYQTSTTVVITITNARDLNLTFPTDFSPHFSVVENTEENHTITMLEVTDTTMNSVDRLIYTLTTHDGEPSPHFAIRKEDYTAIIYTRTHTIDREAVDLGEDKIYRLVLNVSDPDMSTDSYGYIVSYINIEVLDENDNSPTFLGTKTVFSITENGVAGELVGTFEVVDPDASNNGSIHLSITSIVPFNVTHTEQNSGRQCATIKVVSPLDREIEEMYVFFLQASDQGNPGRQTMLEITVNIIDVNDNRPKFCDDPPENGVCVFVFPVKEDHEIQQVIARVEAVDYDTGSNADLRYEFVPGVLQGSRFTIEASSGKITLGQSLDREQISEYEFQVRAVDGGNRASTATVIIEVKDVNEFPPVFTNSSFFTTIAEDYISGVPFTSLVATDQDITPNAIVKYALADYSLSRIFDVNKNTGEISIKHGIQNCETIDFERTNEYKVNIIAYDNGSPPRYSNHTLTLEITDVNEHAPTFDVSEIQILMSERAEVGSVVLTIEAYDLDYADTLQYSMSSDTPFTWDGDRSALVLSTAVNYEASNPVLFVQLNATDGERKCSIFITVIVVNENNHQPVFSTEDTTITLSENAALSSSVFAVHASDADNATSDGVVYSISDGNTDETFYINPQTGVLYVAKDIDYEAESRYVLTILATDTGAPALTSTPLQITVEITNENDEFPVFEQDPYTFTLLENNPEMPQVGCVQANDVDDGAFGVTLYSIVDEGDTPGFFLIHKRSGCITPTRVVDRENNTRFVLTVQAQDKANPAITDTVQVTVIVSDLNDNGPSFSQPTYLFYISPDHNTIEVLGRVTASDPDSEANSTFTYTIVSQNPTLVSLSEGGDVRLLTEIPSDYQSSYTIVVRATSDVEGDDRYSEATVVVIVESTTAHHPRFSKQTYEEHVSESVDMGHSIFDASEVVTDQDGTSGLRYSFVDEYEQFALDSETGLLTLQAHLNYEDVRRYELQIRATDSTSRAATATLVITVEDGNDHAPVFVSAPTELILSPIPYTNIELFSVKADDDDIGDQGMVGYSIVEESSGTFEIDSRTGVVTNKVNLITNDVYVFVIRAFDHGSPLMSSNITVTVRIDDTGDPPVFSNGESTIDIPVPEDKDSKTDPVIQGFSTQPEAESYHLVYSNASKDMFAIDMSNKLVLNSQLDYETASQYLLIIEARSINNGMRLSSFLLVNIIVTDVNDNAPQLRDIPRQQISELHSVDTEVFTIQATDADSGRNADITFAITGGNGRNDFEIDPVSGAVTLIQALNRETTLSYNLTIRATDDGETQMRNETTVFIEVLDVNDNPPVFSQANYSISVYEFPHSHIGDSIIQIAAQDADVDSLSYYIELLHASLAGNIRTVSSDTFNIHFDTGNITLNRNLNREEVDSYFIKIEARDTNELHTAVVYLTVTVNDVNDNAPVFVTGHNNLVVNELLPENTLVLGRQEVTDRDIGRNSIVKYSLGDGWPEGYFKIHPWTGVIRVATRFEFDKRLEEFVGRVRAVDQGVPPRTGEMTVRVYIRDVNNYPPVLDDTHFHFEVSYDHPLDEPIAEFNYSDMLDNTLNTLTMVRIPYYYTVANGLFQMALLDMQTKPVLMKLHRNPLPSDIGEHNFRIEAVQQSSLPLCPQYIQASYANVTVVIHPTNSHSPLFANTVVVHDIPETQEVGTEVLIDKLFATDADGNAVTYKILTENVPFHISDPSSPKLTITEPLNADDATTASYTLTVQASDDGFPVRSSNATLTIQILDVNDIPPVFAITSYRTTVLENSDIGTSVLTVSATDADSTSLSYSIAYPTDCDASCFPFKIEPSGEINTVSDIDYEEKQSYTFSVEVSDKVHITSVTVTVNVIGENEYQPTFPVKLFEFKVSAGQTIVGTVQALDQDGGSEGRLLYSFADDIESQYDIMWLNETTGEISLVEIPRVDSRRRRDIEDLGDTVIVKRTISVEDSGDTPQSDSAQISVVFDKSYFEELVAGTSPATPTSAGPPFEIIIVVVLAVVVAIVVFLSLIVVAYLCTRHSRNKRFKVEDAQRNQSNGGGSEMTERYCRNGTSLDSKPVGTTKLQTGNSASGSERSYTGTADDEMDSGNERYHGHSPHLPNKTIQNGSPRVRSTSDLASSVGTDALHSQTNEHPYTKAQLMRIYAANEELLDDNISHDSVHMFGSEGGGEADGDLDISNLIYQKINDLEDDEESTTIMDDDASTTYSKGRGTVLTSSVDMLPAEEREDPLNFSDTPKGWIPPTGRPIDETIDEITGNSSFASQEEPRRHGYDLGPYSHSQGASLYNPSATQESFIGIQQPPKMHGYSRRYYPEEHHERITRERERERPRYQPPSHRYGSASVLPDFHHPHYHRAPGHRAPGHRQHHRSQDLAPPYSKYSPYTPGTRRPHPHTYMTPTEGTDGTVTPQTALNGDYHYLSSSSTSLTSTNVSGNLSQPSRLPQMYH